ncbi:hypothetical protein ONE63_004851 [Megalurothrips usitatus]|uniref:Protein takeout-like n=1 Tax=Megalurothrips usitatus TaxID=439358 RepID=A0AAV7X7H8_9NEOP|nr:hypothetical protein ONE63_004851 [Megalurothrips usitatus]
MRNAAIALALLALGGAGLAAKLPAGYPTCNVKAADLSTCLAKAVDAVIHKLKDGDKALGLPSDDPLHVKEIVLDLGHGGPISILLTVKDLDVRGLSKSIWKSAKLDTQKHELVLEALTEHMRMDFQYTASGKILVIAVQGDGPAFFEFDNVNSTHTLKFKPVHKKDKTFWTVTDYKMDINPGAMRSHLTDLLKGNKAVSDQINAFLNTEWRQFYAQIKGPGEEAFGTILKSMSQRVFDRIPITDIFINVEN